MGFIFQFFNLLPMLTAEENITLPLSIAGEKLDRAWFPELIDRVGLKDRLEHRPSQLSAASSSEWRSPARLVSKPSRRLRGRADRQPRLEHGREILEVLREAVETYGQTTVMVTHDANAATIADRVLFLVDGEIVRDRPVQDAADPLHLRKSSAALIRVALKGSPGESSGRL